MIDLINSSYILTWEHYSYHPKYNIYLDGISLGTVPKDQTIPKDTMKDMGRAASANGKEKKEWRMPFRSSDAFRRILASVRIVVTRTAPNFQQVILI